METIIDRFLRYVAIDTQSDVHSETTPSTRKQLQLLGLLRDELQAMGLEATMDERGYVRARIPSNCPDRDIPALGFIAHADTSPDASGQAVKPQIIENYDGGDIALKGVSGLFLKPEEFLPYRFYVAKNRMKKSKEQSAVSLREIGKSLD